MRINTAKLTRTAFFVCLGLVMQLLENLLPPIFPFAPGVKLGISNIAPLMAMIMLGIFEAYLVLIIKTVLAAIFSGMVSGLMYSIPSGIISLTFQILLYLLLFPKTGIIMISVLGAMIFNFIQLFIACLVADFSLMLMLPVIMITSIAAGAAVGLCVYLIIKQLPMKFFFGEYKNE